MLQLLLVMLILIVVYNDETEEEGDQFDQQQQLDDSTANINDLDESNVGFMWEHHVKKHANDNVTDIDPTNDFKFSLIESMNDPLNRQRTEAILIKRAIGDKEYIGENEKSRKIISMNRKFKYFAPRERFTRLY